MEFSLKLLITLSIISLSLSATVVRVITPSILEPETQKIRVEKDERFAISLVSNPSTGYKWFNINNVNSSKLTADGEETSENLNTMPGAPTQQLFYFNAKSTGYSTLYFEYRRFDNQDIKNVMFNIEIVESEKKANLK